MSDQSMTRIIKRATGNGVSPVYSTTHVPDWFRNPFNIGLAAVIVSGSATYSVDVTLDDTQDPDITPVWFTLSTFNGLTASSIGNIAYPCGGIRLSVTSGTGTVALTIMQAGTR